MMDKQYREWIDKEYEKHIDDGMYYSLAVTEYK